MFQLIKPPSSYLVTNTQHRSHVYATTFEDHEKIVPLLDVPIKGHNGLTDLCMLLDSGSNDSYISRTTLTTLEYILSPEIYSILVTTFNGKRNIDTQAVQIINTIDDVEYPLTFYVRDDLLEFYQEPEPTLLNDDNLNPAMKRTHTHLDAIIGINLFHHFISQMKPVPQQRLVKIDTPFGTTYGGFGSLPEKPLTANVSSKKTVYATQQRYVPSHVSMDTMLKAINKLCEIETMPHDQDETGLTLEEKEAIERVQKECILDPTENRFVTSLLMKHPPNLANNYYRALAMAKQLHKRQKKDPAIKKIMKDRIEEFVKLDIAQRIYPDDPTEEGNYYSPMRLVTNMDSETTPFRLTSNASASTMTDESLNSSMLQTPVPVLRIAQLMLKNRRYKNLICFDIRKMYIQILIEKSQRGWVRFIWLDPDEDDPKPQIWEFKRLIWGLACSAFISAHCIQELINMALADETKTKRELDNADRLSGNIYVDDVAGGDDIPQELVNYFFDSQNVLGKGSFPVGKVKSNSSEVLSQIPDHQKLGSYIENGREISSDSALLGYTMHWKEDTIIFKKYAKLASQFTGAMKSLLSLVAKLYDPLGLISPYTNTARMIISECFRNKITYPDPVERLPSAFQTISQNWLNNLSELNNVSVNRYIPNNDESEYYFYSDASEEGICAVAYCRTEIADGVFDSNMITAKCTTAPLKLKDKMSIPRMELASILLCFRLYQFVSMTWKLDQSKCHFFNDNVAALWWLRGQTDKQVPYVANRVKVIQDAGIQFFYVRSEENPADVGTRPAYVSDLMSSFWLKGPEHLRMNPVPRAPMEFHNVDKKLGVKKQYQLSSMAFPTLTQKEKDNTLIEVINYTTNTKLLSHDTYGVIPRLEDISDLDTAIHKLSLIMWIIDLFRRKTSRFKKNSSETPLMIIRKGRQLASKQEYRIKAENYYIKLMQEEYFPQELATLLAKKQDTYARLPAKSRLMGLAPFIDENDIIRVGGRVQAAPLTYDQKHPIIVHDKSVFAQRIVAKHHGKTHAFAGPTILGIRNKFHLLRANTVVKKFIQHCIRCQEFHRNPAKQMLGPYREQRFLTSTHGHTLLIDYSGHLLIRQIPDVDGNSNLIKAYIIIYMQMNTRFLYLDIVCDMSAQTFLDSFATYCNQYGHPKICMTDGALYFTSAAKTLNEVNKKIDQLPDECETIKHKTTQEWQFNHPYSPHKGADWERNLKSVKELLSKTLRPLHTGQGDAKSYWPVTFQSLRHTLVHICAVMNSRPLVSPDVKDFNSDRWISPARLVLGIDIHQPSVSIAECSSQPFDYREAIKQREETVELFWTYFMQDYVTSLQKAGKWQQPEINLRLGQIVLMKPIRQIGLKRPYWKQARVVRIIKDKTGLVRTVHVWLPMKYTKSGRLKLKNIFVVPVQHVVPLEIYCDDDHYQTRQYQIQEGTLVPEERDSTPERERWFYLHNTPLVEKEGDKYQWKDPPELTFEDYMPRKRGRPRLNPEKASAFIPRKRGRPPKPTLQPIPEESIQEHDKPPLEDHQEHIIQDTFTSDDFDSDQASEFNPDEDVNADITYYQRRKLREQREKDFYARHPRRSSRNKT